MDWYSIYGINDDQAYHLTELDNLRTSSPIIWALVQGKHTSLAISQLICYPHDYTLGRLREYKREGMVWDHEGRKSILWNIHEDYLDKIFLRDWVQAQRRAGGLFYRNEESQD